MKFGKTLTGLSVLIVEDNFLIAHELQSIVERAGGKAVGPAPTETLAAQLVDTATIDGAFVDVQLSEGSGAGVVNSLKERHIPFVVVTGFLAESIPRTMWGAPFVAKPYTIDELLTAAGQVFGGPCPSPKLA